MDEQHVLSGGKAFSKGETMGEEFESLDVMFMVGGKGRCWWCGQGGISGQLKRRSWDLLEGVGRVER